MRNILSPYKTLVVLVCIELLGTNKLLSLGTNKHTLLFIKATR